MTLRAFQRVTLAPGETRHVRFALPTSQLAYYSLVRKSFFVEPGMFDLMVGSASDDIRVRMRLAVNGGKS
jgi:beta-glucosidase